MEKYAINFLLKNKIMYDFLFLGLSYIYSFSFHGDNSVSLKQCQLLHTLADTSVASVSYSEF